MTAWLLALPAMALWFFRIAMQGWAANQSSDDAARWARLEHSATMAALTLAAVLAVGPALISAVAFTARMRRTGTVFAVLAVAGTVLAVPLALGALRTFNPPSPPQEAPTVCQEHSGGDTRCPGG